MEPERVDEDGDFDPVSDWEAQRLEQGAAAGELPGEGLGEAGEPRLVEVDERARHELGDPASLVRRGCRPA